MAAAAHIRATIALIGRSARRRSRLRPSGRNRCQPYAATGDDIAVAHDAPPSGMAPNSGRRSRQPQWQAARRPFSSPAAPEDQAIPVQTDVIARARLQGGGFPNASSFAASSVPGRRHADQVAARECLPAVRGWKIRVGIAADRAAVARGDMDVRARQAREDLVWSRQNRAASAADETRTTTMWGTAAIGASCLTKGIAD